MIIPYIKGNTGKVALLNHIHGGVGSSDITYCCADMQIQISVDDIRVVEVDPPFLSLADVKTIKKVRYCMNCGEKVETKRIGKKIGD